MTLKTRITLISVLTTFVVAAILITVAMVTERMTQQRVADAVLHGNALIWEQLLNDQFDRTARAIEPFEREFELRAAIKQKDKPRIADYADRFVNLTGDSGQYDLLQILDTDQTLLYSSQPSMRFARLDAMLSPVIEQQLVQRGILTTSDGTPMAVVAFPVQSRRKLKGMALYGKRLDGLVARLAQRSDSGIAVATHRLIEQSGLPAFSGLEHILPAVGEQAVTTLAHEDRDYVFSIQAILDVRGEPVAHLLVARDDTASLQQLDRLRLVGDGIALLAILLGMLVLFFSLKRYMAPLQGTVGILSRIASGDLTARVPVKGVAEIAELENAMDAMVVNLRDMVGNIGQVSSMIRNNARAMEHSAEQAHQSIAEQTSRSEKISQSLSEMAHAVAAEAKVTEQAAGTAVAMRDEASQGHKLLMDNVTTANQLADEMKQVGGTIEHLNQDVELVTEIIHVIKAIAEQTNLLALNAAIEAARAGEQGRGFAVVADEVRALAGRTQNSTTEIEQIIDKLQSGAADSVQRMRSARDRVRENMEKAQSALDRFDGIGKRVDDLVAINQTIAAAVEEQGVVTRDVSRNMDEIQRFSEQNSERTGHLSNTSHSLNELAGSLAEITAQFRYQPDAASCSRSQHGTMLSERD